MVGARRSDERCAPQAAAPHAPLPPAHTTPIRATRPELLEGMSPDILCIQEGNAMTFELEFAFMRELGYDVVKYSKK